MSAQISGMLPAAGQPFQERHLETAVRFAAYVVVRYGDRYAPTFERLENELAELRRRRSPADRARLAFAALTVELSDSGLEAISRASDRNMLHARLDT